MQWGPASAAGTAPGNQVPDGGRRTPGVEEGACEGLLALFYKAPAPQELLAVPKPPPSKKRAALMPPSSVGSPTSRPSKLPQQARGAAHRLSVYPHAGKQQLDWRASSARTSKGEGQGQQQSEAASNGRSSTRPHGSSARSHPSRKMQVVCVERPIGPTDPHAASFEASCSAIAGLRDLDRLDLEAVRVMRDAIECYFAMSREDFAGRHMLRFMKSIVADRGRSSAKKDVAAGKWPQAQHVTGTGQTPGFVWATEVLSTPNTSSCCLVFANGQFEATCNDLMSSSFMDVDELCKRCNDMRSTYAHTLVSIMTPKSAEAFMRAVFESCFSSQPTERQAIVQLKDRAGELVRCLTTVRCHWIEGTVALAIRFWPFSSLLDWPSFTEQA